MKELNALIKKYLKNIVKIEPGYEDAKATHEEAVELENILRLLLKTKYEPSFKGRSPIEIVIINRTTTRSLDYVGIPYDNDDYSNATEQLRYAEMNLSIASREVRSAVNALDCQKRIKE